jgi:hypothetical protein
MVPPPGETDQVTAVDCGGVVPATVAPKLTVPAIVVETTEGLIETVMTAAGCATVKLTFGPSCQAPAES